MGNKSEQDIYRVNFGVREKLCPRCEKWKPATQEFWDLSTNQRFTKPRLMSPCKKCRAIGVRNSRQRRIDKIGWEAERLRVRRNKIKQYYGITAEEYEIIFQSQGGRCATCRIKPQHPFELGVDHNHDTGEIRGLLCSKCNLVLGLVGENQKVLIRMVRYLREYQ